MKALYVRWCTKHWGMSWSALAWKRAQEGKPWCRDRIDGAFLFLFSDHNHCQAQFQKETRREFKHDGE